MVIYTLCDSGLPGVIRYVGQTSQSLEERLRDHLKQALKRGKKSHKCDWIRKVYSEGRSVQPGVIAFASTNDEADTLEIQYISKFRSLGFDLTNIALGGSTVRGLKWSEESKKRASVAAKRRIVHPKHTEEFKKKLGDRRRGIVVTEETRKRLSLALRGKTPTLEQKQKMIEAQRLAFDTRGPESSESSARRRAAWVLRKQKKKLGR